MIFSGDVAIDEYDLVRDKWYQWILGWVYIDDVGESILDRSTR
jgi:hypothetical protein